MSKTKKVLVTGVGGVVGQGILRNIKTDFPQISLFGTDISLVSAANHLCERVIKVPYAYDSGYIPLMQELIASEGIDLIIPSTDYEYYYLALNQDKLKAIVPTSSSEFSGFCLDKWKTFVEFDKRGIPFVKSWLPSTHHASGDCIVKPREGRGSRGIHVKPQNPKDFPDTNVVQEYLDGEEITTCFYVTKKGELHGVITMSRDLEHGSTSKCEVYLKHEKQIQELAQMMAKNFFIRGSCNIQSRVVADKVIPFEINCRISGTNSIRPHFGFKDVKYTVQEYLFNEIPEEVKIIPGCAIRYSVDIIYPNLTVDQIKNKNDKFYLNL